MIPFGEELTDVMSSRFDEMMHVAFTVENIRFTRASDAAYAIVRDWLGKEMTIETPQETIQRSLTSGRSALILTRG